MAEESTMDEDDEATEVSSTEQLALTRHFKNTTSMCWRAPNRVSQ